MTQYDVIVVGGGVVGCSTAYRLAKRGQRVLLLDRRGLASGASGRNGGLTGSGSAMHTASGRAVYALNAANLAMLPDLPAELDAEFDLLLPGNVDIASSPEMETHLKVGVAAQQAAGLNVQFLDTHEARTLMPSLAPDILGVEYAPGRGHLWPFALVHAFADAARRLGAEIRVGPECEVTQLVRRGDQIEGVKLANGETIHADAVVLCTNAYTPHLLPDLPPGAVVPARGQILVTEAVGPLIPHPWGNNFDKEYGRQTADGKLICGGFRRLDEDEGLGHEDERVTPAVLDGIRGCLTRLFPATRSLRVVRCWAGIMGFTADGLPLIGRYPDTDGLFVAVGFNGTGFSWAAITGQVMADLVTGADPGFDLAPFDPGRFATGDVAWANPFTAGEKSHTAASVVVAAS